MDVTALALRPTSELIEEQKPARGLCLECDKPATRSDNRCAKHSGLRLTRQEEVRAAGEHLDRQARRYARLHMKAAMIAAAKGDAEPIQWALERTGAVKMPEKAATNVGVQVYVGTVLPGLREV